MRPLLFTVIFFIQFPLFAQNDLPTIAHKIFNDAKTLYNSEKASWNGTDIFLATPKYAVEKPGGYFSYAYGDSERCVFFSKGESPYVVATITFDSTFDNRKANVDLMTRPLTPLEGTLFTMRRKTEQEVKTDTALFRYYPKPSYNLIPVVKNGEKKMYIITGTHEQDKIIFGNDYLLTFDTNDQIISKKKLHNSILVNDYKNTAAGPVSQTSQIKDGMHTHVTGNDEFMTVTDLCTLLLYAPYISWDRYAVISAKYLSIWQRTENGSSFVIIPTGEHH